MEIQIINENNSNSSNNSKKTRNKPTKAQIYKEERRKIILELEKLIKSVLELELELELEKLIKLEIDMF